MHACLRSHCVAAWRRWPHGPTRRVARTDRRAPDTCCCCARNTAGSVRWRLRETKSRASERERERARGAMAHQTKYDDTLFAMMQQHDSEMEFLNTIFGFLQRRTACFNGPKVSARPP